MSETLPDLSRLVPLIQERAQQLAADIADAIRAEVPVGKDTGDGRVPGRLRDGIAGQAQDTADGATITITSEAPYTPYVLGGTAPHEIRPVHAGSLHFTVVGGVLRVTAGSVTTTHHRLLAVHAHSTETREGVFAKVVHHPGTAPNDFIARALPQVEQLVVDAMSAALAEALS
jgi:hypothetical protein